LKDSCLVKLLFRIVFCCCYHVYGELKISKNRRIAYALTVSPAGDAPGRSKLVIIGWLQLARLVWGPQMAVYLLLAI